jgi:hypothetical protein
MRAMQRKRREDLGQSKLALHWDRGRPRPHLLQEHVQFLTHTSGATLRASEPPQRGCPAGDPGAPAVPVEELPLSPIRFGGVDFTATYIRRYIFAVHQQSCCDGICNR